jgi:hypothetical protein
MYPEKLYKWILVCGIIGILGLPFVIIGCAHGLYEAININSGEGVVTNFVFLIMHFAFFFLSVLIVWKREYVKSALMT